MPSFSNARRVKHTAAHMFDLVADVEHYPEFVPLCAALRVKRPPGWSRKTPINSVRRWFYSYFRAHRASTAFWSAL